MDRPALPLPRASRRSRLPVRGVAVLAMASALFLSAAPAVSDDSATHPGQAQDAQEQTPVIVLVPLDTPEDWGSAIPDDPGILKRPVPATATGPASPEVRVRLDPGLGEWTDAVRAVVLASPSARIAEPAELELRTLDDFPLTLQMVGGLEPEELPQSMDQEEPMTVRESRTIELGNLMLKDYAEPLRSALDGFGRANALLASAKPAGRASTVTCFISYSDTPVSPTCDVPVRAGEAATLEQSPLMAYQLLRFAVGNRDQRPQYVALLGIDTDKRITRIPLQGEAPLAPGTWAQSDGMAAISTLGAYWLVTVASERPLPDDLDSADFDPGDGVSVTVSRHDLVGYPIVPIGGGLDVPAFDAPWMAEFYSTVPYTKAQLDADDAKPEAEREYLRKRSPAELAHRCGGTLIAPDLVLTAAHCVAKDNFAGKDAIKVLKTRRVRLGSHKLGMGGSTYAIDAMAVHDAYRPERKQKEHDIALLRLKPDRGSTGASGTPIGLIAGRDGTPPMPAGSQVAAYGWGYTGVVAPGADPLFSVGDTQQHNPDTLQHNPDTLQHNPDTLQRNPDTLQVGELEAKGWKSCRKQLGTDLGSRMLCAVSRRDLRGGQAPRHVFSCRGDSGGPLIRQVNGEDMLVGVASWSRGCGYLDYPSVYTDVSRYAAWLDAARAQLRGGEVVWVKDQPAARTAAD